MRWQQTDRQPASCRRILQRRSTRCRPSSCRARRSRGNPDLRRPSDRKARRGASTAGEHADAALCLLRPGIGVDPQRRTDFYQATACLLFCRHQAPIRTARLMRSSLCFSGVGVKFFPPLMTTHPLEIAAIRGCFRSERSLTEKGPAPCERDRDGRSAAQIASHAITAGKTQPARPRWRRVLAPARS